MTISGKPVDPIAGRTATHLLILYGWVVPPADCGKATGSVHLSAIALDDHDAQSQPVTLVGNKDRVPSFVPRALVRYQACTWNLCVHRSVGGTPQEVPLSRTSEEFVSIDHDPAP